MNNKPSDLNNIEDGEEGGKKNIDSMKTYEEDNL